MRKKEIRIKYNAITQEIKNVSYINYKHSEIKIFFEFTLCRSYSPLFTCFDMFVYI